MAIDDDMFRIHDDWNDALRKRDAARLGALYSANATFESPAVLLLDDQFDGAITGREEIVSFYDALFGRIDRTASDLFITGDLFFDGRLMAWERSAEGVDAAVTRSVETMEIDKGLILHHRVYWNWVGMRALRSALPPRRDAQRVAPLILASSTKRCRA